MQKSIEEISELQKRKSKRVIFPELLGFSIMASPLDFYDLQKYYKETPNLFWQSIKENFIIEKYVPSSNSSNVQKIYQIGYVAPACLIGWFLFRSVLLFPLLISVSTIYSYSKKRRDPSYWWTNYNLFYFKKSKKLANDRQNVMRLLWWKYPEMAAGINSLDGIEKTYR